jgi:hypothetical protein
MFAVTCSHADAVCQSGPTVEKDADAANGEDKDADGEMDADVTPATARR